MSAVISQFLSFRPLKPIDGRLYSAPQSTLHFDAAVTLCLPHPLIPRSGILEETWASCYGNIGKVNKAVKKACKLPHENFFIPSLNSTSSKIL